MKNLRAHWRFLAIVIALALCLIAVKRFRHTGLIQRTSRMTLHALSGRWMVNATYPFWRGRLSTPTQITKIGSLYFIADCFHNRVIYSPSLDTPIAKWSLLDGDLAGPHSIASDSILYVVDDTGRNSLRVYRYHNGKFEHVQTITNLGRRTHRVRYDPDTTAFYALSANSQQMTKLVRKADHLEEVYEKPLPFLKDTGTRSFTFMDGYMLFVSGPTHQSITKVRYKDDSYEPVDSYDVPPAIAGGNGMNDIFRSGKYLYMTASQKTIIRTTSLDAFRAGQWEDVYSKLGFKGTPYYIEEFDGRIYVPQVEEFSGIVSFVQDGAAMKDVRTQFNSGGPKWVDDDVQVSLPK